MPSIITSCRSHGVQHAAITAFTDKLRHLECQGIDRHVCDGVVLQLRKQVLARIGNQALPLASRPILAMAQSPYPFGLQHIDKPAQTYLIDTNACISTAECGLPCLGVSTLRQRPVT